MESGAKELILFHHDPDHDDVCIDKVVKEARNYYPRVRAAAEGMQMEVSGKAVLLAPVFSLACILDPGLQ